jgi:predicted small secreted protein
LVRDPPKETNKMRQSRWLSVVWLGAALALGAGLAACGDTWQGLKKDTGDNLEAVGSTMEGAGEDVKEDAAQ